ncbi:hypothetical protein [Priestia koreensis]|uniref:hypothetical protein n=1 Tax=Priestia koreensis TaxID=284581 RepID=UPI0028F6DFDD|nr:hypothetical protein [Priestia koreensis]
MKIFAEALLVYLEFIKKVKVANGRRAYLEKNAPHDLVEWVYSVLQKIDAISLKEGSFWKEEIDSFNK